MPTSSARVQSFTLGRCRTTQGIRSTLPGPVIQDCFERHARCDFGAVCDEDYDANIDGIAEGNRIMSVYEYDGLRLYVITEADRSETTLMLADEY